VRLGEVNDIVLRYASEITLAGNSSIVFASLFAVYFIGKKVYKHLIGISHLNKETLTYALGMVVRSLGEALRIGWWIPAIMLAPEDGGSAPSKYNQFFYDYKVYMMLIATPLIVVGISVELKQIKGRSWSWALNYSMACFTFGWLILALSILV
jgi:hypothetical protein